jgi:photosystem II stability/assembly factor-like uncharacterized protein
MLTCLSPNGGDVTHATAAASNLLVGTVRGVYGFARDSVGSPWKATHTAISEKQISSILYEPRSGLVFAGVHGNGGLWCSHDAGVTSVPRMNGIDKPHVYTITAQYRGPRTVLFAGVEPPGLYRSDDLGATWHDLTGILNVPGTDKWTFPPPPHIAHVKHVAFHPFDPATYYVCIEQGALLKTVDDGRTWIETSTFESDEDLFRNDAHRTVIRRSDPNDVFLATGEGLYRSLDGGLSWVHVTYRADRIGYPDVLFLDPRNENVIYLGGAGVAPREWRTMTPPQSNAGLIRSDDNGRTWIELNEGLPQPVVGNIEAMTLHQWGDRVAIYAGTATGEVYSCEEAGSHWQLLARDLPPISKAGHYRWFLTSEQRANIEGHMRSWDPSHPAATKASMDTPVRPERQL